MSVFRMDGQSYNVRVKSLKRKFSVLDTDKSGRVQTGEMYRDIIGTFHNYEMIVVPELSDREALNRFYDEVSKPVASHLCEFPYGNAVLIQKMYVTSGEQELLRKVPGRNAWGELSLSFIAMEPKERA